MDADMDDLDDDREPVTTVGALTRAEDALSEAAYAADTLGPADVVISLRLLAAGCRHISHLLRRAEAVVESDFAQLVHETDDEEVPIVLGVAAGQLGSAREHLIALMAALQEARRQVDRIQP